MRDLFALAEESEVILDELLDEGRVLVAMARGELVGCLQLLDRDVDGEVEISILAVAEGQQGRGIGSALIERAVAEASAEGLRTLRLGTSSADIENLRFYQRREFRMLGIERDAFTEADGYPKNLTANGIPVRDRVWLTRSL